MWSVALATEVSKMTNNVLNLSLSRVCVFTFQESGDNTVDVEFVRLSHLPALPKDLVLHEVPRLKVSVLNHKRSFSVERKQSLWS